MTYFSVVFNFFFFFFFFCYILYRYGEERYEKKELQIRVRKRFEELEKMDKMDGRVPWHFVSATQSIEQVHEEIWSIVTKTLEQVHNNNNGKSLGQLWKDGSYEVTSVTQSSEENEDNDSSSEKENMSS